MQAELLRLLREQAGKLLYCQAGFPTLVQARMHRKLSQQLEMS